VLLFDDRGLGFANPQGSGPQNVAMNNGGYMPYPQINYAPALQAKVMFPSDANFAQPPSPEYLAMGFTGRLECVPHDMVHDNVGGWMGNVPSSAGDPIFFVHHCQIDRLYASWEAEPGVSYNWGKDPMQPSEQTWKNRSASFVDERGDLVNVNLGNAIDTGALSYGYDNLAKPTSPHVAAVAAVPTADFARALVPVAMRSNGFSVGPGGGSVTLEPAPPAVGAAPPGRTAPRATTAAPGGSLRDTNTTAAPTTLVLEGIKLLRRPPAPLGVFLNLPPGTAPELNSPFYVGSLSLFKFDLGTGRLMAHGDDPDHPDHAANAKAPDLRFDVSQVLERQRARGLWEGGAITVTVTTIGATSGGDTTYVSFESAVLTP
jgi:tyrosinase